MPPPCRPIVPSLIPTAGALPSWANPTAIMAGTAYRLTTVVLPPTTVTLLLPANPKRVAWGPGNANTFGGNLFVGPSALPSTQGWPMIANAAPVWWYLFAHGPMVNMAWFGSSAAGGTLAIHEIYLLA